MAACHALAPRRPARAAALLQRVTLKQNFRATQLRAWLERLALGTAARGGPVTADLVTVPGHGGREPGGPRTRQGARPC
eukprot:393949-Hanusia_phi.AAC.1